MTDGRDRSHEAPLGPRDKGAPGLQDPVPLDAVAARNWRLLHEDLPLPVAVLKERALRHNSQWMKDFLTGGGAMIAPHGKTTMSPALFDMQIDDGAWAITLATPHQIQVARSFGYGRIVLANQLVGRSAIDAVLIELKNDPAFEFYCLADNAVNVAAIARRVAEIGLERP